MTIFAIFLTLILEQKQLLNKLRIQFESLLVKYAAYFIKNSYETQKQLRLTYLFACIPVFGILLLIKLIFVKHQFLYFIFNLVLFILTVQILTWKEEAKLELSSENRSFISTYATRFFAPLFWYLILPASIGSICYLIIIFISHELKSKNIDSLIYNTVVDKILFYINLIPYSILFILISFAGNFEESSHFLLEQKKNFSKSFFNLENILNDLVLVAIGKDKFQIDSFERSVEGLDDYNLQDKEHYEPKITQYIVAILYRSGLFFIGILTIINIALLI